MDGEGVHEAAGHSHHHNRSPFPDQWLNYSRPTARSLG